MSKTKFKFLVDGLAYLDNLENNIQLFRDKLEEDGLEEVGYKISMGVSSVLFTIEYKEKEPGLDPEKFIDPNQTEIDCEVAVKPSKGRSKK